MLKSSRDSRIKEASYNEVVLKINNKLSGIETSLGNLNFELQKLKEKIEAEKIELERIEIANLENILNEISR